MTFVLNAFPFERVRPCHPFCFRYYLRLFRSETSLIYFRAFWSSDYPLHSYGVLLPLVLACRFFETNTSTLHVRTDYNYVTRCFTLGFRRNRRLHGFKVGNTYTPLDDIQTFEDARTLGLFLPTSSQQKKHFYLVTKLVQLILDNFHFTIMYIQCGHSSSRLRQTLFIRFTTWSWLGRWRISC